MDKQQWVFPGVMQEGKPGTLRVTRKLREGLRMDYEANTLSVVTYYDVTWRGDAGGVKRGIMTPESLEKLRNPPPARLARAVSAAPENGETLCGLEYRAYYQAWVYPAGYSDARLCRRRADSLEQSFGVPFRVYAMPDGDYYAAADWRATGVLRAAALRGEGVR